MHSINILSKPNDYTNIKTRVQSVVKDLETGQKTLNISRSNKQDVLDIKKKLTLQGFKVYTCQAQLIIQK